MLRARLTGVLSGAMIFVLVGAIPAHAQDGRFSHGVECSERGCTVGAHSSREESMAVDAPLSPAAPGTTEGGGRPVPSCVEPARPGERRIMQALLGGPECEAGTFPTSGEEIGQNVVAPVVLAEQARAAMVLPDPRIGTAPPLDTPRFVNMASWMWVDAADWEPVSATASVSAGSVTVVATPERVLWDTGDGHQVVCEGPGAEYSPAVYREEGSPDCGHTYTTLPPGGAGADVELSAVWEWAVSWSTSTGDGGVLEDLATSSMVAVPVSEIHSVVTHTG